MVDVYKYVKPPVSVSSQFNPEEFPIKQGQAVFKWNGATITITVQKNQVHTLVDTKEEYWNLYRPIKPSEDTWKLLLTEVIETAHGLMLKSAINLLSAIKSSGNYNVLQ